MDTIFPQATPYAQLTLADALVAPASEDIRRGLVREAITAVLNAANDRLDYPFARYADGVDGRPPLVPTVNGLLQTGNGSEITSFTTELAVANGLGCPLR